MLPSFVHLTHLTRDRMHTPYRRATHFAHHMEQLTGRNADPTTLKPLIRRLKRAGVKADREPMAYYRVRRLLKRWGYGPREYRCIFAMLKAMGGPVLSLSYPQEQAIRSDFEALCAAFDQRREVQGGGGGRKNFLSYYLVIQLLLDKYRIPSFYRLPSVKDVGKFRAIMEHYVVIAGVRHVRGATGALRGLDAPGRAGAAASQDA